MRISQARVPLNEPLAAAKFLRLGNQTNNLASKMRRMAEAHSKLRMKFPGQQQVG